MVDPFEVTILVEGPVYPKKRPRFGRTKTGIPIVFTDKQTENYEKAIQQMAALAMRGREPFPGPVEVSVLATLKRPDGVDREHPTYRGRPRGSVTAHTDPDADNVLKIALDGINKIVFKDDIQAVAMSVTKRYGSSSSLFIRVTEMPAKVVA